MFVKNFMSSPVTIASPEQTLAEALRIMEQTQVRRLPVVDHGKLVGILTRSDIHRVMGAGATPMTVIKVVMTRDPETIAPDETLERAALTMIDYKISGLPVVDDGSLVGIVTESDIFRALVKMLGFENRGARLAMELSGSEDILERIRKHVGGLQVQSLVTHHDPIKDTWSVVVRVRGRVEEKKDAGVSAKTRRP